MSDITLSKAVRSNLLNLQSTAAQMGKTQERLSTGNRVNSALDNPTNFFTASALNSRASDLGLLMDSVSNAVQTIAAADKGIKAITKLVESAQATARQALQSAATVVDPNSNAANAINAVLTAPTTFTPSTASTGGTPGTLMATADFGTLAAGTPGTLMAGTDFGTLSAGTPATTTGATYSAPAGVAETLTLNTVDITIGIGDTITDAIDAINAETATTGVTATDDGAGAIVLTSTTSDITVATTAGGFTAASSTTNFAAPDPLTLTIGTTDVDLNVGDDVDDAILAINALTGTHGVTASKGTGADVDKLVLTSATADVTIGSTAGGFTTADASTDFVAGDAMSLTIGSTAVNFADGDDVDAAILAINALTGTHGATASKGTGADADKLILTSTTGQVTVGSTAGGYTTGAASTDYVAGAPAADDVYTINNVNISIDAGTNLADTIIALNARTADTGVVASEGTGLDAGKLVLTSSSRDIAVSTAEGGFAGTEEAEYTAAVVAGAGSMPNPKRAELIDQYNDLLTQIDQLTKDSGFNGVNLINGDDLEVIFNEDGTSKLAVDGQTIDSSGMGLTQITDMTAWDTNAGINTTLSSLKSAIEDLRTSASKFGSNLSVVETRQNFTKDMINVLQTGAANLTLADTNEEAANLLALQTRQQLSSTALSMASQADQQVLQLF